MLHGVCGWRDGTATLCQQREVIWKMMGLKREKDGPGMPSLSRGSADRTVLVCCVPCFSSVQEAEL